MEYTLHNGHDHPSPDAEAKGYNWHQYYCSQVQVQTLAYPKLMVRTIGLTFILILTLLLFGFGGSLVLGAFQLAQILFYCFVVLILLFLLLAPGLIKRR